VNVPWLHFATWLLVLIITELLVVAPAQAAANYAAVLAGNVCDSGTRPTEAWKSASGMISHVTVRFGVCNTKRIRRMDL